MRIKHILVSILFTAFILSCETKVDKVGKALALEIPMNYEDPCDMVDDYILVFDALLHIFKEDPEEMDSKEFDMKAFQEENPDLIKDLTDIGSSIKESYRRSNMTERDVEDCDKYEEMRTKGSKMANYF